MGEVQSKTAAVAAADGWKYSFENLPQSKDGKKITYTVSEQPVDGYKSVIDGNDYHQYPQDGEDVCFRLRRCGMTRTIRTGRVPSSVTVQLYANGVASGEPVALDEANSAGSIPGVVWIRMLPAKPLRIR